MAYVLSVHWNDSLSFWNMFGSIVASLEICIWCQLKKPILQNTLGLWTIGCTKWMRRDSLPSSRTSGSSSEVLDVYSLPKTAEGAWCEWDAHESHQVTTHFGVINLLLVWNRPRQCGELEQLLEHRAKERHVLVRVVSPSSKARALL